jgi:hypothetical protein
MAASMAFTSTIRELTPDEGRRIFDSAAEFLLEMSGEEAIKRIDSGTVDDLDPDALEVLALLLPLSSSARTY